MRPFDYISTQLTSMTVDPAAKAVLSDSFDKSATLFLTVSAQYLNLPAERLKQLKQQSSFSLKGKSGIEKANVQ